MRKLLLAFALLATALASASAQQFPTVPSGTVIGRTQVGTGPAQAIPILQLFNTLLPNGGALSFTAGNGIAFTGTNPTVISVSPDTTNASNILSGMLNAARLPTVISSATSYQGGLAVGPSAAVPATTDFYNYNSSRAPVTYWWRDQILGSGSSIGDAIFNGNNSSGTKISWVDNFAAVPYCRGRPSFGGFICATTTTTAGSEEGAFYITNLSSNTITLATSAGTTAGNSTLTFASSVQDSGNLVGKIVADQTFPTAIPAGTYVRTQTATSIGLSQNVSSPGVSSGDSITFTGKDQVWFDANGINIGGQRNLFVPAGQGIVSFDTSGTATYNMSFNSHANNSLDFQSCNNVGITCSSLGAVPAMRWFTSASGSGQPIMQINYDSTVVLKFANGGVGTTKLCLDASKRLTSDSCP